MSGATDQLLRLLRILPLASREGGLSYDEAASICGSTVRQIQKDLDALTGRADYLPAGSSDDVQIMMDAERIHIFSPGGFGRPIRLTHDEQLAVALSLRCAGLRDEDRRELCLEVERALAFAQRAAATPSATGGADGAPAGPPAPAGPTSPTGPTSQSDPTGPASAPSSQTDRTSPTSAPSSPTAPTSPFAPPTSPDPAVEFVAGRQDPDGIEASFALGVRERRRVRFGYVKSRGAAPEIRTLEPVRIVHAEGEIYVVGFDVERDEHRLFRLDRVLGCQLLDISFTRDPDFRVESMIRDGRVLLRTEDDEYEIAEVRYSPRVSRWVRERYAGTDDGEGSYTVRHELFSHEWLVRHVLQFGAEAEVLSPEPVRARVLEAVSGPGEARA